MEFYIVKAQIVAKRVYVHFSYALAVIACLGKLACHGIWVFPRNIIFISGTSVMFLCHTGMKSGSCGDTAWTGAVSIVKRNASAGKGIKIRSFYIRMSRKSQTISTKLVCHNKQNIRFIQNYIPPFVQTIYNYKGIFRKIQDDLQNY